MIYIKQSIQDKIFNTIKIKEPTDNETLYNFKNFFNTLDNIFY